MSWARSWGWIDKQDRGIAFIELFPFYGYLSTYLMPLFYSKRADLVGRLFCPFPFSAAHLECEMIAGTPAAILDHKVTLRM